MISTSKPAGRLCDACAGSALTGPPPATEDPARHVGEIFRRLTLASETYPGEAFTRIVTAMLVAMGRACLVEAEAHARWLRERAEPARPGIKVGATARRVDFDAWDPGDLPETSRWRCCPPFGGGIQGCISDSPIDVRINYVGLYS